MPRYIPPAQTIARLRQQGNWQLRAGQLGCAAFFGLAGLGASGWLLEIARSTMDLMTNSSEAPTHLLPLGLVLGAACAVLGWFVGGMLLDYWFPLSHAQVTSVLTDNMLLERVLDPYAYEQLRYLGVDDHARRYSLHLFRRPSPARDNFDRRMRDLVHSMRRCAGEIGASIFPAGFQNLGLLLSLPMFVGVIAGMLFLPGKHSDTPIISLPREQQELAAGVAVSGLMPLIFASIGALLALQGALEGARRLALADLLEGREEELPQDIADFVARDGTGSSPGSDTGTGDASGWG